MFYGDGSQVSAGGLNPDALPWSWSQRGGSRGAYFSVFWEWGMSRQSVLRVAPTIIWVALMVVSLGGCGTSTASWEPPGSHSIDNEKLINSSFDDTWDRLIQNLAKDFFVINNVEKNSRILNVSISTTEPFKFIDCGVATRVFNAGGGQKETVVYPSAGPADYRVPTDTIYPAKVQRRTELEGRVNIYVAPKGTQTLVTVNSKYVLIINTIAQRYYNFNWHNFTLPPVKKILSSSAPSLSDEGWYCVSNGVLEMKIIALAEPT